MPGWHEATKKWVAENRLTLIGVIQEQHPERCRLFAQWKQFDWPIVHDPINLFANSAVPMAIAIDEHGIVRSTRPNPKTFERDFLNIDFPVGKSDLPESIGVSADFQKHVALAKSNPTPRNLKLAGDSLVLWASNSRTPEAIGFYEQALKKAPNDAAVRFRLGVAHLMRYESSARLSTDFRDAISNWQSALDANPNQYIWRRRIQQFGPRLDKPYPFYDWVETARKEIVARGEKPIPLPVEPVGAELASRSRKLEIGKPKENPDPGNRIKKDTNRLVKIDSVVVPHTYKPESSAMIHILFSPGLDVAWGNEAGPLTVWLENGDVKTSDNHFVITNRKALESDETRKVEVEVSRPPRPCKLKGFALYHVCEKDGQCTYLRQDFVIELK